MPVNLIEQVFSIFSSVLPFRGGRQFGQTHTANSVPSVRFVDAQGNFELLYPRRWSFDSNIAMVDGKYTVSFQSPDKCCQFTIAVDSELPKPFDFEQYVKEELESPLAGVYATPKKTTFHDMPAYERSYEYLSGKQKYFGAGVMFLTGSVVFSLSWGAPEDRRAFAEPIFASMLKTLKVKEDIFAKQRKRESFEATAVKGKCKI